MKRKFTINSSILIDSGCALSACTQERVERHCLRSGDSVCSCQAAVNAPVNLSVIASGRWKAVSGQDWLAVESFEEEMELAVADNQDASERGATVTVTGGEVTATISVMQLSEQENIGRYLIFTNFYQVGGISKNGKYFGGDIRKLQPEESFLHHGVMDIN